VHRLKWLWEGVLATADDGAAHAEATLSRWMDERSEKPFFWFVNLIECHSPYLPPRPYADRSPINRALAADEAFRYLTFESFLLTLLGKRTVPEPAIERMHSLYRSALRYVDDWLARMLELLDGQGFLKDTLLVVCSDHGENFGVGGLMGHGLSLDDRLLRVPLVVAGPGESAFEGMRSLIELPSRVARAVGLETHPWSDGGLPTGLAVAQWDPFVLNEALREMLEKDWGLEDEDIERLTSPLTCAVDGHLKLVRGRAPEDESLFDLEADPLEVTPLRGEKALRERAGPALEVLREAVNHPAVQYAPEHVTPAEPVPSDERAEIEHRMRLLGYM
jgi:arylsulfatase A-like enzyme